MSLNVPKSSQKRVRSHSINGKVTPREVVEELYRVGHDLERHRFNPPITPDEAIEHYRHLLQKRDFDDINNYKRIYFLSFVYSNNVIEDPENFQFQQNGHIAFRFEQIELLGRGTFGTVIRCVDHKKGKQVAIKLIDQNSLYCTYEYRFLSELKNHGNGAENNNILKAVAQKLFRGFICVVTNLYSTDVYSYLKSRNFKGLPINELKLYGWELARALSFSHELKIVHCDLKPENVLFKSNSRESIALIDFGSSCYEKKPLYAVVQSLYYRAPEVIFQFRYGVSIDIWSYGCVMYELATGKPLFSAVDEDCLVEMHKALLGLPPCEMVERSRKMLKFFQPGVRVDRQSANKSKVSRISAAIDPISPELSDLIAKCLEWLPAKRIDAVGIMKHPFFEGLDIRENHFSVCYDKF